MSKPDKIPDDIWRTAELVEWDATYCEEYDDWRRRSIADALLAERERCARIAESRIDTTDYDLEPEAAVAENVTAKGIAAQIRAGAPA